jgi:hypothetical protein
VSVGGVADVSGGSARPPTQPHVNRSVGAADVGRFAAAHPGELVAALGAVGYLLGYVNVRLAAAGLGVASDDLALSTNDYVVVALAWTVFFAVFAVGYVVQLRLVRKVGWRSLTGNITAAAGMGLGVTAVVITGSALSARAAIVTAIVLALFAGTGWWLGGAGLGTVTTVAVALAALGPPSSYEWGRELREEPASSRRAPLWLEIVLSVERGTADFAAGPQCAVRISDRVYVTAVAVQVEPAAIPFQSDDCLVTP